MKQSAILEAFLIGASVGITVGLLLAPDAGENTRNALSYRLKNLNDKPVDFGSRETYGISDLSEKGLDGLERLKENLS